MAVPLVWTFISMIVTYWLLPGVLSYLKTGVTGEGMEESMMTGLKFYFRSLALLYVGINVFLSWYEFF